MLCFYSHFLCSIFFSRTHFELRRMFKLFYFEQFFLLLVYDFGILTMSKQSFCSNDISYYCWFFYEAHLQKWIFCLNWISVIQHTKFRSLDRAHKLIWSVASASNRRDTNSIVNNWVKSTWVLGKTKTKLCPFNEESDGKNKIQILGSFEHPS